MLRQLLKSSPLYKKGKLDWTQLLILVIPLVIFLSWRIFTLGIVDSESLITNLEHHLIDSYKEKLYSQYGMYDANAAESGNAKHFPSEELIDLEVLVNNVAMSSSLFSWSIKEDVGIRFDYQISKDGIIKEQDTKVHLLVTRRYGPIFRSSNPVIHLLQYF